MRWRIPFEKLRANPFQLLPTVCVVCLRQCDSDFNLCTACADQLPKLENTCDRCGLPFSPTLVPTGNQRRCGACVGLQFPVESCHGLYHYRSPVDALLSNFKFGDRLDIGFSLSRLLARAMGEYYETNTKPDLLIPVPIHTRRYLQRGFNQAWELTKHAGRLNGIGISNRLVMKTRHTEAQSKLASATERKHNLRDAFAINPRFPLKDVTHVTIIDDVVTTMSTVTVIAKLLQSHGIPRVDVWCVARASRIFTP